MESLLDTETLNNKNGKQNITSTIWDIFFFNQNKKNIIKSNLFLSFSFKNYLILWIINLFVENEKYTTNTFFFKNKQISKLNSKFFSNILSIDELNIAFSTTEKYKNKFRVIKKQKNKFF